MNMTRRAAIGGMIALPATAGAAQARESDLARFLGEASATDRATYHANQLADALAEAHGGAWIALRVRNEDDRTFCMMLLQEKLV